MVKTLEAKKWLKLSKGSNNDKIARIHLLLALFLPGYLNLGVRYRLCDLENYLLKFELTSGI